MITIDTFTEDHLRRRAELAASGNPFADGIAYTEGQLVPIAELDGAPVGDGEVGKLTLQVWSAYWEAHYDDRYSFPIDYSAG